MKKFDADKYLRKNPAAPLPVDKDFRIAVVIPAYDENENIFRTLGSCRTAAAHAGISPLIIVVINYPPGADPAQSEKLLQLYHEGSFPDDSAVIWLPELAGGVGAARKAGMDAFIARIPPEEMENSVIYSLDADTVAAPDYFSRSLTEVLKGGAVSLPFSHLPAQDRAHQQAIDRYEAYLRRYVDKLKYAGSPYAFFTIGSAFAVRGDTYIRAGGMKVKKAGEDFYFLQTAAKISRVCQLEGVPMVYPSSRVSARVPFGTGPAVGALIAGKPLNEIPDHAFEKLKGFLTACTAPGVLDSPEKAASRLPVEIVDFLRKEGFFTAWNGVTANLPDDREKRLRAFHEWFDGLKTLKFLHFFSDLSNFDIDKKAFKC